MMAAITAVLTLFVRIPFGPGGYVHLGDMAIYLSASLLPLPYAVLSAAVGGALADLLSGYALWAPFTLLIKAVLVLPFTNKESGLLCRRNYLACVIGVLITVAGYYLAEGIIYGDWMAVASIPWNVLQAVASAAVYIAIALPMDRMNLKTKLLRWEK